MREQKWKISEQKYVRSSKRMFWHLFSRKTLILMRYWHVWCVPSSNDNTLQSYSHNLRPATCSSSSLKSLQYWSKVASDVNQTVEIILWSKLTAESFWPYSVGLIKNHKRPPYNESILVKMANFGRLRAYFG